MKMANRRKRGPHGFTLVELLIALAVLAILTALALPAYNDHVARAMRAEARAQLQLAAQYMHRFYAANDSYATDRAGTSVADIIPTDLMQSPAQGNALYRIEFGGGASEAGATGFTLVMRPVPGSRMERDFCGALTLDASGRRGALKAGANLDACWR